jgi:penicillin-binding protein
MKRILLAVALAFGLGVVAGCRGGTDTKSTKKTEPTGPKATTNADDGKKNGTTTPEKKEPEKKEPEKKEPEKKEPEKKEEKKEEKKDEKK